MANKRKAVYIGSFDPVHVGHMDIIKDCSNMFDEVVIGILINKSKKYLYSVEERLAFLNKCVEQFDNVTVKAFDGLAKDFVLQEKASIIVRGMRNTIDFEAEKSNRILHEHLYGCDVTFVYLLGLSAPISSTILKEIASFNGDISKLVPECLKYDYLENPKTNIYSRVSPKINSLSITWD